MAQNAVIETNRVKGHTSTGKGKYGKGRFWDLGNLYWIIQTEIDFLKTHPDYFSLTCANTLWRVWRLHHCCVFLHCHSLNPLWSENEGFCPQKQTLCFIWNEERKSFFFFSSIFNHVCDIFYRYRRWKCIEMSKHCWYDVNMTTNRPFSCLIWQRYMYVKRKK